MEYLIGLLIGVVFFICLILSFYFGYRLGRYNKPVKQVDPVQQRKAKELRESFTELMSYDTNKALQRKKVTHE